MHADERPQAPAGAVLGLALFLSAVAIIAAFGIGLALGVGVETYEAVRYYLP